MRLYRVLLSETTRKLVAVVVGGASEDDAAETAMDPMKWEDEIYVKPEEEVKHADEIDEGSFEVLAVEPYDEV